METQSPPLGRQTHQGHREEAPLILGCRCDWSPLSYFLWDKDVHTEFEIWVLPLPSWVTLALWSLGFHYL